MTSLYITVGIVIVVTALVAAIYWLAKRQGRREAELEAAKQQVGHAKEALELDDRVHRLTDDERRRWLYGRRQ